MDIEDFTLKLIRDYREKEEACEALLSSLRSENRKLRRDGKDDQWECGTRNK